MSVECSAEQVGFAPYNVVAVFPDMEAARRAIEALEAEGVDSARISLLGPRVEEAAQDTETEQRDEGVTQHVEMRVATGAAVGTVAGGAAGFLVGTAGRRHPRCGPGDRDRGVGRHDRGASRRAPASSRS